MRGHQRRLRKLRELAGGLGRASGERQRRELRACSAAESGCGNCGNGGWRGTAATGVAALVLERQGRRPGQSGATGRPPLRLWTMRRYSDARQAGSSCAASPRPLRRCGRRPMRPPPRHRGVPIRKPAPPLLDAALRAWSVMGRSIFRFRSLRRSAVPCFLCDYKRLRPVQQSSGVFRNLPPFPESRCFRAAGRIAAGVSPDRRRRRKRPSIEHACERSQPARGRTWPVR